MYLCVGRGWTQSDVNIAPVLCVDCMNTLCMYVCLCAVILPLIMNATKDGVFSNL